MFPQKFKQATSSQVDPPPEPELEFQDDLSENSDTVYEFEEDEDTFHQEQENEDEEELLDEHIFFEDEKETPLYTFDDLSEIPLVDGGDSERDIVFKVLALAYKHSLTDTVLLDFFLLLNSVFVTSKFPNTRYRVKKLFNYTKSMFDLYIFCVNCNNYLGNITKKIRSRMCSSCNTAINICLKKRNFFATSKLQQVFKSKLEKPGVSNNVIQEVPGEGAQYTDIHDGSSHRTLMASREKENFCTYNTFVDGAQIFKGSKNSFWCILITLNCLCPSIRFKEVIMGGAWFGKSKPNFKIFLRPFVEQAKKLVFEGVEWVSRTGETQITYFLPSCFVADTAARPELQCNTAHNGEKGCNCCYHPNYVKGRKHNKYKMTQELYENRTDELWLQDIEMALLTGQRFEGVIDASQLLDIPGVGMVSSFGSEWMHSVCLGVARYIPDKIWCNDRHDEYYVLSPAKLKFLDTMLTNMQLPRTQDSRQPKAFSDRNQWKASENKWWLLYLSLPLLIQILPPVYVAHWALLVKAIYLLDQERVSAEEIDTAEEMLLRFVWGVQTLYSECYMTYNVHSLLHISANVRKFGPLWTNSAYAYESYIGKMRNFVTGNNGVVHQVMERFCRLEALPLAVEKFSSNKDTVAFVNRVLSIHTVEHNENATLCGHSVATQDKFWYSKMLYKREVYRTFGTQIGTKNCDSCIMLRDGSYGLITKLCYCSEEQDEVQIEVELLDASYFELHEEKYKDLTFPAIVVNHIKTVTRTKQTISVTPADIDKKCAFFSVRNDLYLAEMANSFEPQ